MGNTVIAEIKIYPFGTGTASVSSIIGECVGILDRAADIKYRITPMATIAEGSLERILELVKDMHEIPFSRGIGRVVTSISIDDRRDKPVTMESKVTAVENRLNK